MPLSHCSQLSACCQEFGTGFRQSGGLSNYAVRNLVGVLDLFARPAALRPVRAGRFGLGSGFYAPHESAEVDVFSAVRAVHLPENNPTVAYGKAHFQSSPLPKLARGEKSSGAKLKELDVIEIRRLRNKCGQTLENIGIQFGVTKQAVRAIAVRKTWRHVA